MRNAFILQDITSLLAQNWRKICLCGFLGALYSTAQWEHHTLTYTAKGGFFTTASSNSSTNANIIKVPVLMPSDPPVMLSRSVLTRVIRELGLQAHISIPLSGKEKWSYLWSVEKLHSRGGNFFNSDQQIIPPNTFKTPPSSPISVSHISYLAPYATTFEVHFLDNEKFEVFDQKKNAKGVFSVDERLLIDDVAFIISLKDPFLLGAMQEKTFTIQFTPEDTVFESLRKNITITTSPLSPLVLEITYTCDDKHLVASIINYLMSEYSTYQQQEKESIIHDQLLYLSKRQDTAQKEFSQAMIQRWEPTKERLKNAQFMHPEHEIQFFHSYYTQQQQRKMLIEWEFDNIKTLPTEVFFAKNIASRTPNGQKLISEHHLLCVEKDELLHLLATQQLPIDDSVAQLFTSNDVPFKQTLETARSTHQQHINKLHKIEDSLVQLEIVKSTLANPSPGDIHIYLSLLSLVDDPVSTSKLSEMIEIIELMDDQRDSTARDHANALISLEQKKAFLHKNVLYIEEAMLRGKSRCYYQLQKSREELVRLISQQLDRNHSYMEQQIGEYKKHLQDELAWIDSQIQTLSDEIATLPEALYGTEYSHMEVERYKNSVITLTRLVEEKNLSINMEKIKSRPLTIAEPPLLPDPPHLLLKTLLGALSGILICALLIPGVRWVKGWPVSVNALKGLGLQVVGSFAKGKTIRMAHRSTLLATLEFLSHSNEERQVVVTLGSGASEFMQHLIYLLIEKDPRIGMISIHIDPHATEGWRLERVKTNMHYAEFDLVLPEEKALSLLQSITLREEIKKLAHDIQYLFLTSPLPASSPISKHISLLGNKTIALFTVNEHLKDLEPYSTDKDNTIFVMMEDGEL